MRLKGKFIVIQYDDVESKPVQKTLTCLAKDEIKKKNGRGIGVDAKESSLRTWLICLQIEKLLGTNGFLK